METVLRIYRKTRRWSESNCITWLPLKNRLFHSTGTEVQFKALYTEWDRPLETEKSFHLSNERDLMLNLIPDHTLQLTLDSHLELTRWQRKNLNHFWNFSRVFTRISPFSRDHDALLDMRLGSIRDFQTDKQISLSLSSNNHIIIILALCPQNHNIVVRPVKKWLL